MNNKSLNSGFTLIELMIVVAIVGILAAIAYPSYQEQIRTSRRANCAGELVELASAMERDFTLNGQYSDLVTNGYPQNCPRDGSGGPYYTFSSVPGGAANQTYLLTAARTGPQATDKCGNLTLTNTGIKGMTSATSGLTVQNCW